MPLPKHTQKGSGTKENIKLSELYHINHNLSNERKIEMEQKYETALEIILNMCKKDGYVNADAIVLICETVLKADKESGDCDACA